MLGSHPTTTLQAAAEKNATQITDIQNFNICFARNLTLQSSSKRAAVDHA
jgi:hypothetical protein